VNLEIYSKDPPQEYDFEKGKQKDRAFALVLSTIGIISIAVAIGPILIWSFSALPMLGSSSKNAPIPSGQVLSLSDQSINVNVAEYVDGFSYFTTDYKPTEERPEEFYISIPKLNVKNATVKVDYLNFYENLSHFPGTALPGEVGNAFITGHSVLPQFTDPENYRTIFSKLPELEVGDVINIESEGASYKYIVQYKKIVSPKDISVLKPISKGAKNLTLMTCVPPGTSIKRMVVVAALAD